MVKCYKWIASELTRSFCNSSMRITEIGNMRTPLRCKQVLNPNYGKMITFIIAAAVLQFGIITSLNGLHISGRVALEQIS